MGGAGSRGRGSLYFLPPGAEVRFEVLAGGQKWPFSRGKIGWVGRGSPTPPPPPVWCAGSGLVPIPQSPPGWKKPGHAARQPCHFASLHHAWYSSVFFCCLFIFGFFAKGIVLVMFEHFILCCFNRIQSRNLKRMRSLLGGRLSQLLPTRERRAGLVLLQLRTWHCRELQPLHTSQLGWHKRWEVAGKYFFEI